MHYRYTIGLMLLLVVNYSLLLAQDTSCGIVWSPPVQLSPNGISCYVPKIAVQGDTVHLTWKSNDGPLYFPYRRSVNGGKSFEPLRQLVTVSPHDSFAGTDYHLFIASRNKLYGVYVFSNTNPQNKTFFIKSDDRGTTWTSPFLLSDSTSAWHFYDAVDDTILLGLGPFGNYRRIFRSTNAGLSWIRTIPSFSHEAFPQIAMIPGKVFRIFGSSYDSAGYYNEYVIQYKTSTDLGDSWTDSNIPLSTIRPSLGQEAVSPIIVSEKYIDSPQVVVSWQDTKYGCLGLGFCSIMERHLRNGYNEEWSGERTMTDEPRGASSVNAIRGPLMAVAWAEETSLAVGATTQVNVKVSRDGGMNWCPRFDLTPDTTLNAGDPGIAIVGNTIIVAWSQAPASGPGNFNIFYRRGEIITGVHERDEEPSQMALSQNYPNPFNPATVIRYEVMVNSFVHLNVYNIYGQEVATLVNKREGAGEHIVQFNAVELPSGLYFYRLSVTDNNNRVTTLTKKMILLK